MKDRQYCVYILTNTHDTVLYTGVTDDLQRRVLEHRSGAGSAFTKRYKTVQLCNFLARFGGLEALPQCVEALRVEAGIYVCPSGYPAGARLNAKWLSSYEIQPEQAGIL